MSIRQGEKKCWDSDLDGKLLHTHTHNNYNQKTVFADVVIVNHYGELCVCVSVF